MIRVWRTGSVCQEQQLFWWAAEANSRNPSHWRQICTRNACWSSILYLTLSVTPCDTNSLEGSFISCVFSFWEPLLEGESTGRELTVILLLLCTSSRSHLESHATCSFWKILHMHSLSLLFCKRRPKDKQFNFPNLKVLAAKVLKTMKICSSVHAKEFIHSLYINKYKMKFEIIYFKDICVGLKWRTREREGEWECKREGEKKGKKKNTSSICWSTAQMAGNSQNWARAKSAAVPSSFI